MPIPAQTHNVPSPLFDPDLAQQGPEAVKAADAPSRLEPGATELITSPVPPIAAARGERSAVQAAGPDGLVVLPAVQAFDDEIAKARAEVARARGGESTDATETVKQGFPKLVLGVLATGRIVSGPQPRHRA